MTSDWDEIKRLAADFQKVQLSSTLQKLSETNCIEVVNLLIEKGLANVIFTLDGKEYITPEHLRKQIGDELYVHGRINLVEVAKNLNVDLTRITDIVDGMLLEPDNDIYVVLGQLMNEEYLKNVATEINDNLAVKGEISVFELASNHFDLPSEFLLHNVMEKYLGTIIHAKQDHEDNSKFFTQKYISRCKAKLRGALAGLTMPTPVSAFFEHIGSQDALYHSLMSEINPNGTVTSRQKGALFVPHIYTKTQTSWVDSFYKQNGYLEYDAVERLGVTSPIVFIKRQLANENCKYLSKCCVDQRIISQMESALTECISTGSFLEASTVLPSVMLEEDITEVLQAALTPDILKATKLFETTIVTTPFLEELLKPCDEIVETNATESVATGKYQQYFFETQLGPNKIQDIEADSHKTDRKDDRRRKATGGKGGGGTQGRETKTKSTKKHYRGGDKNKQSDSEDEDFTVNKKKNVKTKLELISVKDIQKVISKKLEEEGLDYLERPIANQVHEKYCKIALERAHGLYELTLQTSSQDRRQTHAALQEKLNNMLVDMRLYEKGLKLMPAAQQPQLVKYLMKTLGTDVCNEIFLYVAAESNLNYTDLLTLTPEQRVKITQECGQEYKAALVALNKALPGTIEDFFQAAENALQACSMILKKIDKKKDRTLILCHKHGLLEKLSNCQDPALVLHLAVLVIFTISAQNMLHASGKQVSAILSYLQPVLSDVQRETLQQYHDLVLKLLSSANESEEIDETSNSLIKMTPLVKEIATAYKKPGVTSAE